MSSTSRVLHPERAAGSSSRRPAFLDSPAHCIAPRWLRDCLGDIADDATMDALAGHPRFQRRLMQLLIRRHDLPPPGSLPAPGESDLTLLRLPSDAGDTLVHYCGMICHAMAFVREIRAPRVVALKERFGEAAFAAALASRELAISGATFADDDALAHAVHRDGSACFAAWLSSQPAELIAWLRLGLACDLETSDAGMTPEIHAQGVLITRRAAAIIADIEPRESHHERATDTSEQDDSA